MLNIKLSYSRNRAIIILKLIAWTARKMSRTKKLLIFVERGIIMRILIVQLSDMHCRDNTPNHSVKIPKIADALKTIGPFDGAAFLFTGDLTDTASKNEFSVGRKILANAISALGDVLQCGTIPLLIVPGNHDMVLPNDARDANEILSWEKADHLDDELKNLNSFFDYANSQNCFKSSQLCDVRTLNICGVKIQVSLLNSAPFSTRKEDDKQLHTFPCGVADDLSCDSEADLKILAMHHSYEWFDWATKEMLRKSISNYDIAFFGHDHSAETITIQQSKYSSSNIVMGGKFDLTRNADCAFNAIIYDTETNDINVYEFHWHSNSEIFVPRAGSSLNKKQLATQLVPTGDYLDNLLSDSMDFSQKFTEYFVFPKLLAQGAGFSEQRVDSVSEDEFFNTLDQYGIIKITGRSGSGRSSLIKYLYQQSIDKGYSPLLVEKRELDSRFDKMFENLFELQYGKIEDGFERYKQLNLSRRIIFIDDFDLISSNSLREKLFSYITTKGGLLVYSSSLEAHDLTEMVKEKMQGNDLSSVEILPFYKDTRDKLVGSICRVKNVQEPAKIQTVINVLDYLVQGQPGFFTLNPGNLAQFIKYLINDESGSSKGAKTLSFVFETNIRNAMLNCAKSDDVTIYLAVLSFVAHYMFFVLDKDSKEMITFQQLEDIISKYNEKRRASVNAKYFYDVCKSAKVLADDSDSFRIKFASKNTYAYFVAMYISRELERNPANQDEILYVMNHICFGINDVIVLFLSYIRGNFRIILNIASKAEELLKDYQELDFDLNNLPFLREYRSKTNSAPTEKDRAENTKAIEKIEEVRHESIGFRGIFDYNEDDVEKEPYRVQRAFRYAQLIGRALVDQYGNLDGEELDSIIASLYSIPQKVLYAMLKPYQDHYEEILEAIDRFAKQVMPEEEFSKEYIRQSLSDAAVTFSLNVMNDIAFNATNSNTIVVLNQVDAPNSNHRILNLMMEDNSGNSASFVDKAVKLNDYYSDNFFIQSLITRIARKHIIYTPHIDRRQIDRLLSGKILSSRGKKQILLDQHRKNSADNMK